MINGITFKWQAVRPEDDGRIYEAMLTDGIIHGCTLSFAGHTLTLGQGFLIAAGRLVKVPAAQNYACSGAAEGIARLVLTIDLLREATPTEFDQIQTGIEYALAAELFTPLTQQDINNGTSNVYQLEIARVSLGPSGITGIVSSLPAADYKEGKS